MCLFDTDSQMILFKRPMEKLETDDKESEQNTAKIKEEAEKKASSEIDNSRDKNEEIKNEEIFRAAIAVIKESGRDQDFLAVLEGQASGALSPHNIALQLFLDIGIFLSAQTVHKVRYSNLTLNFWTLVKKLFHGKAISFFRGNMAGGSSENPGNKGLI